MKNKKKAIALIVSVALIAAIAVGATMAYLSDQSGTVENTFEIGAYPESALDIFEHQVAQDPDSGDYQQITTPVTEVQGIDYDAVLPGTTLDKDPTLRLAADSPSSYLIMKASNIEALAAEGISIKDGSTNIGTYWLDITASVTGAADGDTYYIYCPNGDGTPGYITATALTGTDFTTQPLFTQLSVSGDYDGNGDINLVFKGCVVQYGSDMTSYSDAIAALPTSFIG